MINMEEGENKSSLVTNAEVCHYSRCKLKQIWKREMQNRVARAIYFYFFKNDKNKRIFF